MYHTTTPSTLLYTLGYLQLTHLMGGTVQPQYYNNPVFKYLKRITQMHYVLKEKKKKQ